MPVCEKHGTFYHGFCHDCNQEKIQQWRADDKKKKADARKLGKKLQKRLVPNNERERLKKTLQANWRRLIYPVYKKMGYADFCWICGRRFVAGTGNKLYSAHVSHYYAKSHVYQLWCDPVNSGICCYGCNVDKPEIVAAMEPMIIKVWGQERFDKLKSDMEYWLNRINMGLERRYPSTEWLMSMVVDVKNIKILS